MKFDVRQKVEQEVTQIVFAESTVPNGTTQATYIRKPTKLEHQGEFILICDIHTHVNIASIEDAENLIKALNKAIQLGWLV